jgi:sulfur-oxidizing protein SoxX
MRSACTTTNSAAAAAAAACLMFGLPLGLLSGCAAPGPQKIDDGSNDTKVKTIRAKWVPGSADMIPQDVLNLFPCHEEELPCFKIKPAPVERVNFAGPVQGDAKKGEAIAINVRYGNCIACHTLPNGHDGGSIGPSLREYAQRGLPLAYTYQRIWDVRAYNPSAFMPVYGPNKVLTPQEIHDVMAFILGTTTAK